MRNLVKPDPGLTVSGLGYDALIVRQCGLDTVKATQQDPVLDRCHHHKTEANCESVTAPNCFARSAKLSSSTHKDRETPSICGA